MLFVSYSVSLQVIVNGVDYARTHPPAVVFIDEIDAIGSKRRENVGMRNSDSL